MRPIACNYYITFECNDTCEFCRIWRDPNLKNINLSSAHEIKQNLRHLKELGVLYIDFTGGEPLLYEDLPEILSYAKELSFFTTITTNCILYRERAKEIASLPNRLNFSLDSPLKEEHDRIRGVYSFDLVLESIKIAKSLKESPVINFTVTRDSVRYLPEMVELCDHYKVLLWINPVFDYEGFDGFERQTLEYIGYFLRQKSVVANLASLELIKASGKRGIKSKCRAAQSVVTISPDNYLILPCFYNELKKVKIEGNLKEIYKKELKEFRLKNKDETCQGCMRWPYMIPSFYYKLDKYFFLNLYSLWDLLWKEHQIRKEGER